MEDPARDSAKDPAKDHAKDHTKEHAKEHVNHYNVHFEKKLPKDAEASNILVGEVDFLEEPISAFVRLSGPLPLGDLTEVSLETRFLFILLGPSGAVQSYHEIG